ncbi:1-phosphatidylinositol phosphodiesterase [Ceratocystis lukuohia]|uniref:1-phosphatidylinositol phosphodiesterase n=1 Tax=Ceratocystis lukuohia TaxID=2019550 RepID=A0ABR4MA23_9PEZI
MQFSLFATLACLAFTYAGSYGEVSEKWSFDVGLIQSTDWMGALVDNVHLSNLAIPGTHGSMTNTVKNSLAHTQNVGLTGQLNAGIRYIDVSCRYIKGNEVVYSGPFDTGYSLEDVLASLFDFLDAHPREATILRIRKSDTFNDCPIFHSSMISNSLLRNRAAYRVFSEDRTTMPVLGEVRGKVVLLQDFKSSRPRSYGIPWSSKTLSDYDHKLAGSGMPLALKWSLIKSRISQSLENDGRLRITYATASIRAKPMNTAEENGLGVTMNRYLGEYLLSGEGNCFGIIVMDFPGYQLVDQILKLNRQYWASELSAFPPDHTAPEVANGFHYDELSDNEGPPVDTSDGEHSGNEDVPTFSR